MIFGHGGPSEFKVLTSKNGRLNNLTTSPFDLILSLVSSSVEFVM